MSLLFNCQNLAKSYGSKKLFKNLTLSIFEKQRIGLIGPNGCGKSTLLKIFVGLEETDEGILSPKKGVRFGYIPQQVDFEDKLPKEILLDFGKDHHKADYELEHQIDTWLSKLRFTEKELSIPASLLSGGWKKRLSFAKELILAPDILLLDEPTNHLDLEGILWMEKLLNKEDLTFLVVSHDRYFLEHTVNRVIEINPMYPEGLFSIEGSYSHFLSKKHLFLEGEIKREHSLWSKARKEKEWLKTSPKARTTKSTARMEMAEELIDELSQIEQRNKEKKAQLGFVASERETRKLIVAKNLSKSIQDRFLFEHVDFTLSPGTRLGLLGPNGSGKTTLLRMLASEIEPDCGTIKCAEGLKIVYFDQHRLKLSPTLTLRQALSPDGDYVFFRGEPVHVNGWCKRFLFSPDVLDMPIEKLSGGERARISIAHLMLQPADILLLDEPTNDLDITTLETLEENLLDFPGAIVLITHDRAMLNRVCNQLLALDPLKGSALYASYLQWENSFEIPKSLPQERKKSESAPSSKPKLSYLEKKEYEHMEEKITCVESEIRFLHEELEKQSSSDPKAFNDLCLKVSSKEAELERLYLRWQELEEKIQSLHKKP